MNDFRTLTHRSNTLSILLVLAICTTSTAEGSTPTADPEYDRTVRRGGEDGRPYWNRHAIMFMYPPAFDFTNVTGSVRYRFNLLDDRHETHAFASSRPDADLRPVWAELPVGFVTVKVSGISADGRVLGQAGERTFWRKAPFKEGSYPKARYGYAECARKIYGYQYAWEDFQHVLKHGKMAETLISRYPSKQLGALVVAMIDYAKICPERRTAALAMACKGADALLALSEPADARYPGFTPTYHPVRFAENYEWPRRRTSMNLYPAYAADAFAALYEETKDRKYLAAAKTIGDTYLSFQGEDGSWPLLVDMDKGPVGKNKLVPVVVMTMFERLFRLTEDERYRAAGDRAFAYIERSRIETWNWEGQFEDTPPTCDYRNLTKHDACSTAIYLVNRYPHDKSRIALARELLRFAEDIFVNWEKPYAGGREPDKKRFTGFYNHFWGLDRWICPSVCEQYGCYTPVDASAAKLINTYLALYQAEGDPIDLAKARTLGDTATRCTEPDGCEATWWSEGEARKDIWPNCMFSVADALVNLSRFDACR